mmetsp:Transcript_21307/g.53747  ORF Transcript_21307/g.53747 Transcript_21307/m.53747 type:complete len:242 (-) Transcript_21307:589-1314(-)
MRSGIWREAGVVMPGHWRATINRHRFHQARPARCGREGTFVPTWSYDCAACCFDVGLFPSGPPGCHPYLRRCQRSQRRAPLYSARQSLKSLRVSMPWVPAAAGPRTLPPQPPAWSLGWCTPLAASRHPICMSRGMTSPQGAGWWRPASALRVWRARLRAGGSAGRGRAAAAPPSRLPYWQVGLSYAPLPAAAQKSAAELRNRALQPPVRPGKTSRSDPYRTGRTRGLVMLAWAAAPLPSSC